MSSTPNLRVAIIGASGYGGAELARILAVHPHAELTFASASAERAGAKLSDLFPHLRGICDIALEEVNLDEIVARADFVFIALGHGKAMELVPPLLERGLKVCDLGADFRLRDPHIYEQWYKLPHTATRVLEEACIRPAGMESRENQRRATWSANPGCYPTSAILALSPFVAQKLVSQQASSSNRLPAPAARGAVHRSWNASPRSAQRLQGLQYRVAPPHARNRAGVAARSE
jgi:N-acetyl-gamma-glutamyl-phosphate reductase